MNSLLLLLCGSYQLLAVWQGQRAPAKVTYLQVTAFAFAQYQEFTVTADSILVNKRHGGEGGEKHSRYARAITPQERDALLSPFNNIYLSQLREVYEKGGVTDAMTFNIFIHKGLAVKHIQVYMEKLMPFYTFSRKFNGLVPAYFKIEYDNNYLIR